MNDKKKYQVDTTQAASIWDEIKRNITTTSQLLNKKVVINQSEKDKELKLRAHDLAVEKEKSDKDIKKSLKVLIFLLAGEKYAIEFKYIQEVIPLNEYTPLPSIPDFIIGIINVRGKIYSIVDLKRVFNLPDKDLTKLTKVVLVKNKLMEFGIIVDDTLSIFNYIPVERIKPLPATFKPVQKKYSQGIFADNILILNINSILNDKDMIISN